MIYIARVSPAELKKKQKRKYYGRTGRTPRYGHIKYKGLGFRGHNVQMTTHKLRKRQHPKASKRTHTDIHGTDVFTVKSRQFTYLPHVAPKRQLGRPMALGDDVIVQVNFKVRARLKTILQQSQLHSRHLGGGRPRSSEQQFMIDMRTIMRTYFRKIADAMWYDIHDIVPRATGRLRRGMNSTLNSCIKDLENPPYILKINTTDNLGNPIYYANPVNHMPTAWLAHPPNQPLTRNIGGTVFQLFDPNAHEGWYEVVVDNGRNHASNLIGHIYRSLTQLYGISSLSLIMYNEILRVMRFN